MTDLCVDGRRGKISTSLERGIYMGDCTFFNGTTSCRKLKRRAMACAKSSCSNCSYKPSSWSEVGSIHATSCSLDAKSYPSSCGPWPRYTYCREGCGAKRRRFPDTAGSSASSCGPNPKSPEGAATETTGKATRNQGPAIQVATAL